MQNYFYQLSTFLFKHLQQDEVLTCCLTGENSDFVRLNNSKVRQAGSVMQQEFTIRLINSCKQISTSMMLCGNTGQDESMAKSALQTLRGMIGELSEDPYLNYSEKVNNTENIHANKLPDTGVMLEQIIDAAYGLDLVGILASGTMFSGFCNSLGQRNWHSNSSFNFDWSCYYQNDKAVKNNYSGFSWETDKINELVSSTKLQLNNIKLEPKNLPPGKYRVYLAPSALIELTDMMSWNGFSHKANMTRQTPLLKLLSQEKKLHNSITMVENNKHGLSPCFTEEGFIIPETTALISNGKINTPLSCARSAREYNAQTNCEQERPLSLELSAGSIKKNEILKHLDTGIYINNLWYCNFSDFNNCRITGMTRFACLWVENGEVTSPVNVMRFDESIYNILGDNLEGITEDREKMISPGSYSKRSNSSALLPGIIVKDFSLTL